MDNDSQFPSREQMLADLQSTHIPMSSVPQATPVNPPSTLSDFEQGTEKGMGGDIIGAGIQTGADAVQSLAHNLGLANASPTQVSAALKKLGVKGDVGPSSEKAMYKQAENENNAQYNQAQARSPIAYGAGDVAGMGLGLYGGEAALKGLGIGTKIMGAAPEGANLLTRIGYGAGNAAPAGALIGGMQSKGHLIGGTPQEQLQVAKDAGKGAATGTLLGAAASTIGEGLSALGGTKAAQEAKGAYQLGAEGKDLTSPESQVGSLSNPESLSDSLSLHDTRAANTVLNELNQADDYLGHEVGSVLDDATQQGIQIKADPQMNEQLRDLLQSPEINAEGAESANGDLAPDEEAQQQFNNIQFKDFFKQADKLQSEGMTPVELQQFRNELGDFGRKLYGKDQVAASQVFKLSKELTNTLRENVPGYTDAANRLNNFRQSLPETILSKDNPIDVTALRYSGTRNVDTKLLNNIKGIIRGMADPTNQKAQGSYSQLLKGIQDFNQQELARKAVAEAAGKPFQSVFDHVGSQPQDIENFFQTSAARSKLIRENSTAPDISQFELTKPGAMLNKSKNYIANKAGLMFGRSSAGNNPVLNTGKKLYAASNESLKDLSQKISELPGQKPLSEALSKAVEDNDTVKKNALLFSIMQNPNLRNLVDSDALRVGN